MNSNRILRILALAVIALCICGCETEVEFSGEQNASKPVVCCQLIAGRPVDVYISMSIFFLDDNSYSTERYARNTVEALRGRIRNVQISFDGGRSWNTLALAAEPSTSPYEGYGYYDACYRYSTPACPSGGDRAVLKVEIDGYDTITSSTTVPFSPELELVSCNVTEELFDEEYEYEDYEGTIVSRYDNYVYDCAVTLRLTDDASTSDYYRLSLQSEASGTVGVSWGFHSDDPIFKQDIDGFGALESAVDGDGNTYYDPIFSDTIISGRSHTFTVGVEAYRNEHYLEYPDGRIERYPYYGSLDGDRLQLNVFLQRLSPEAYWFATSRGNVGDADGLSITVGEAASLYSNMSAGSVGVLFSYSVKSISIDMSEYGFN